MGFSLEMIVSENGAGYVFITIISLYNSFLPEDYSCAANKLYIRLIPFAITKKGAVVSSREMTCIAVVVLPQSSDEDQVRVIRCCWPQGHQLIYHI